MKEYWLCVQTLPPRTPSLGLAHGDTPMGFEEPPSSKGRDVHVCALRSGTFFSIPGVFFKTAVILV